MKQEKGITILSLVITIIILIILASVTVNTLFGNNGIITRAQEASYQMGMEEAKEQITLSISNLQMQHIQKGLESPTLEEIIQQLYIDTVIEEDNIVEKDIVEVTTPKGYIIEIHLNNYRKL